MLFRPSIDDKMVLVVFQFRYPYLHVDQPTVLIGNPSCPSKEFSMRSASKNELVGLNCVDHYAVTSPESFPFKMSSWFQVWSHQKLVTMMHDLFHTLVINECHIPRFENCALIPFFYHTPKPGVATEVSFYKSLNFVKF